MKYISLLIVFLSSMTGCVLQQQKINEPIVEFNDGNRKPISLDFVRTHIASHVATTRLAEDGFDISSATSIVAITPVGLAPIEASNIPKEPILVVERKISVAETAFVSCQDAITRLQLRSFAIGNKDNAPLYDIARRNCLRSLEQATQ